MSEACESRDYVASSWRDVATLHAKLDAVLTKNTDRNSRELDVEELHAKLDALLDGGPRSFIDGDSTYSSMSDLWVPRTPAALSASTATSPTGTTRSLKVKGSPYSARTKLSGSTSVPPSICISGSPTPAVCYRAHPGRSGANSPSRSSRTSLCRTVAPPPTRRCASPLRFADSSGYATPVPMTRCYSGVATPRAGSMSVMPGRRFVHLPTSPPRPAQAPAGPPAVSTVPMPSFLVPCSPSTQRTVATKVLTWPAMMVAAGPPMLMQSSVQIPVLSPRGSSDRLDGSPRSASLRTRRATKKCCG
mmetsp:Transcript_6064/g.13793  ORF Transcript_6064/g.13793 Transcript_6064/m.13793 type:complete len:304 (-) Transcript_6064:183-1094(-)